MTTEKRKIAILCWDMSHNPLGRAFLLADLLNGTFETELIGPIFPRYGNDVWRPLRAASPVPIKWYDGRLFPEHLSQLTELSSRIKADLVLVSKQRFPSFGLGILIRVNRSVPLILDVDDYELGFFPPGPVIPISQLANQSPMPDLLEPYSKAWTACCEELVPYADAITVAGTAIQRKYGGTVIPHARDETRFDPKHFDRAAIRARFGYGPVDKVILFSGTPRAHKGLIDIAKALAELGNSNYCLCVIGTPQDAATRTLRESFSRIRIDVFPDQPFSDLPANLMIADLVCLLQDPTNIAAQYQVPAKFTDALAMEIPILGTPVPPLQPFANEGLIELLDDSSLAEMIDHIFSNYDLYKTRAIKNRRAFIDSFSFGSVRPRLVRLVENVLDRRLKPSRELNEFVHFQRTVVETLTEAVDDLPRTKIQRHHPGESDNFREINHDSQKQISIAFFWKQNDTGIFGRRNDMITKYLSAHPRVSSAVHFDPPIEVRDLLKQFDLRKGRKFRQNRLVFWATLSRILHLHDTANVRHRTFLYVSRDGSFIEKLLALFIPDRSAYGRFIERQIARENFDHQRTVLFVSPINFDFPGILEHVRPSLVVGDIVDDQRTWRMNDQFRKAVDRSYRETLFECQIAIVNNDNTRRVMSRFNRNIHVIPNGLDLAIFNSKWVRRPLRRLSRLSGPILGYAGNLDPDRLDISLLDFVAQHRPSWQIVLIGSTHKGDDIFQLGRHSNVHILGAIPYPDVLRYVAQFDVALIPHVNNEMTQHMNPLKMFVYFALGIPIVSTAIENIEELEGAIIVAENPDAFVEAVEKTLAQNTRPRDTSDRALQRITAQVLAASWENRVGTIMNLIEKHLPPTYSYQALELSYASSPFPSAKS